MRQVLMMSVVVLLSIGLLFVGCKKKDSTTDVVGNPNAGYTGPTYPVTVKVLGPSGAAQGGALLSLVNPPSDSSIFKGITDTSGNGTIKSPPGAQQIMARMGSVFQATLNVTVAASAGGTIGGTMTLAQTTTLGKVLVIYADCEELESVLRNSVINFTKFDTTFVDSMRVRVVRDSAAVLTYLKGYALVFSDCNCGDEYAYPLLARTYGRYVQQGGKIYGGHYNYYNLQFIFPPYYKTSATGYGDTLKILNDSLKVAVGRDLVRFTSISYYERFSDIPVGNVTVYGVIKGTTGSASSPQGVPVIVENRLGLGKYVWTDYHNQDILADPQLIRIVRYFLYAM
jgi:hypothetical protein